MSRRRLLFVSPRFLFPTDSGGKIRTTQVLRGMKGGEFEITLVSPSPLSRITEFQPQLGDVADFFVCWERDKTISLVKTLRRLFSVFSGRPISVESDRSLHGSKAISLELEKGYDLVVFDFVHSAVLAADNFNIPSVVFTHNVESEIFDRHVAVTDSSLMKVVWRSQYRKMRVFEKETLSLFTKAVAVSDRDKDYFESEFGARNVDLIPTGVDLDYFSYNTPADSQQLVFIGSMDWLANIDALDYFMAHVWPLVTTALPDAQLKVIGRNPPETLVRRAASLNWNFTGFVEDIRVEVLTAAACIIPLRIGGGTRIKAFEAMAMGLPIVSTSIGMEGLEVPTPDCYIEADDASSFSDAILSLLSDSKLRMDISRSARVIVERDFSYKEAAKAFEKICLDALQGF